MNTKEFLEDMNRRMPFAGFRRLFLAGSILAFAAILSACSESSSKSATLSPELGSLSLSGWVVDSVDESGLVIYVSPEKDFLDSMVIDSAEALNGASFYLAADADLSDPALGAELVPGTVISTSDTNAFSIVVLDSKNRVTAVWTVTWKIPVGSSSSEFSGSSENSSSSEVPGSSSDAAEENSSASVESSSSSGDEISSSSGSPDSSASGSSASTAVSSASAPSSSSSLLSSSSAPAVGSSSSEALSSSAGAASGSASSAALSAEQSITDFQITVNGSARNDAVKDDDAKTISFAVTAKSDLNSIQMKRLTVSDGASYSVALKTDLTFAENGDYYEYSFSVTAENGESDTWTIRVTAPKGVLLSDLKVLVDGDTLDDAITVTGEKIYVEVPYGTDLSAIQLVPLDTTTDLRRTHEMEFVDADGNLNTYNVIAGVQLPGTDFSARNDFWATTSDAMATEGNATVLGTPYLFTSSANLSMDGSVASLSTQEVVCAWGWIPIKGGWKMATGIYFAGTYSGSTARDIYVQGYTSGTPSTGTSDITTDMTFGKSFAAYPDSFAISYSYTHVANSSSGYPQKSLIYVILVSSDKKAVAVGSISDTESVSNATKTVALLYGSDPDSVLLKGYAGTSDLTPGDGTEEVSSIRVVFASSAYAHIVAGGAAGSSGNYRGGENSTLSLDDFKLIY